MRARRLSCVTGRLWPVLAIVAAVGVGMVGTVPASAADSDPLPRPKGGAAAAAIDAYNAGVKLMVERRYGEARGRFEQALRLDDGLAEAHNNLAFSLRMIGLEHADLALRHYNRAIAVNPKLARAYMYRGVLLSQMRDLDGARADLARLRELDPALATRLAAAIERRAEGDGYEGLAPQFD